MKIFDEDQRRDNYIAARRALAKDPPHRLFLALVLNLPRRRPILDLVRKAFPGEDPADRVLGWIAEIAKLDEVHAWVAEVAGRRPTDDGEARVLDVRVDATSLLVARHLLDGMENAGVTERLVRSAGGEALGEGEVERQCAALRASRVLRPLFAE
jgi:hypothetical protein